MTVPQAAPASQQPNCDGGNCGKFGGSGFCSSTIVTRHAFIGPGPDVAAAAESPRWRFLIGGPAATGGVGSHSSGRPLPLRSPYSSEMTIPEVTAPALLN